ncbi:hypothetical protein [Streptomyces sp900116325]|uniref:Uncharacterized protein n=1 Tax=Streptomyces sp. 900116325 TaxID=3154295 RepID=A0ABV2ULN7_9ACTN
MLVLRGLLRLPVAVAPPGLSVVQLRELLGDHGAQGLLRAGVGGLGAVAGGESPELACLPGDAADGVASRLSMLWPRRAAARARRISYATALVTDAPRSPSTWKQSEPLRRRQECLAARAVM